MGDNKYCCLSLNRISTTGGPYYKNVKLLFFKLLIIFTQNNY